MKHLIITIEGKTYEVDVEIVGDENEPVHRSAHGRPSQTRSSSIAVPAPAPAPAAPGPGPASSGPGDVPSPLSGNIISIDVKIGQSIAAGDKLITMEAMKMNTIVSAPSGGTVSAIHVQPGDSVDEGKPLLTIS